MKFAALALVAAVSAHKHHHEEKNLSEAFHPKNWSTFITDMYAHGDLKIENIFKVAGSGTITWSQCADDAGVFTLNAAACTVSPSPIKKGVTETFSMHGTVSKPIVVDDVTIEVYLSGSKLSSNTAPGGSYTSDWSLDVAQVIPIFAPAGMYTIRATANGNVAGESMNGTVGCVEGLMDL